MLRRFKLKTDVGRLVNDDMPYVYPLYHTSMRARLNRHTDLQRRDWARIPSILKEAEKARIALLPFNGGKCLIAVADEHYASSIVREGQKVLRDFGKIRILVDANCELEVKVGLFLVVGD